MEKIERDGLGGLPEPIGLLKEPVFEFAWQIELKSHLGHLPVKCFFHLFYYAG